MPTTVSDMAVGGLIHANPLTGLKEKIRRHWAEFRPKMFQDLQAKGKLESALEAAEAQTVEAVLGAMANQHLRVHEAFELFAQEWAYLPSEDEQPELGRGDPGEWTMPDVPADE